jgi:hypothetical protein
MVKIRVEDTYTNEVFETECDGALISTCQCKENDCEVLSLFCGSFSIKTLKHMRKSIKKILRKVFKGEGRIE